MKQLKLTAIFIGVLLMSVRFVHAQTVTGKVTDESGEGLPGASIVEANTTNGTITDVDGNYSLSVGKDARLQFSFVGYSTEEVAVNGRQVIDVQMKEDAQQLEEVVVTAFGINREKRALGYAATSVKPEELVKTATPNFATALYGKVPGLRINSTSGGSTSAVNFQVRGLGSITGRTQPLIVLNGVPIQNDEVTNDNYWEDQRLRGNGVLDINPEDIEEVTVLKGASAAALYGNEALNGVILITTKIGKGKKGLGVGFNTTYTLDQAAYFPRYQKVRGPGYPVYLDDAGQGEDMWLSYDLDGDGDNEIRRPMGTTLNYGPKFDGQPALAWTGDVIPYEAQEGPRTLFQDAHSFMYNLSITNVADKSNTRFSFTRRDNEGVSRGAKNNTNNFNLNTSLTWNNALKTELLINYINGKVINRPYSYAATVQGFGGMMSRFDNGDWYFDRYQTSLGYRFVTEDDASVTPEENLRIPGYRKDILDYAWRVGKYYYEERTDRLIANITQHWQILESLKLRGRIATDYTNYGSQNMRSTEKPLVFGPSGQYEQANSINKIFYGDVLLTYTQNITPDLSMSLMGGYTANRQTYFRTSARTADGLSVENWFSINASTNNPVQGNGEWATLRDAILGTANFSYKDYLFVEATLRRDRTSTMNPSNNVFYYPSVNAGWVFSDVFQLPGFFNFGKLRAAWGEVGNFPERYRANVAYEQKTLGDQGNGPVVYTQIPRKYGNDNIKSETKRDIELGLELKMFNGRFNVDFSYYDSKLKNQILPLTLPISSGASSILANVGSMSNVGYELALEGILIAKPDFNWTAQFNFAHNQNKVLSLAPGLDELIHSTYDGGAARLVSEVGSPVGVFYARPVAELNGQPVVDPNGLYKIEPDKWKKIGSVQPKAIGGIMNTLSYKGISLSALIDYRIGGYVMPQSINWMTGRGLTEESLWAMDKERGGLSWYIDSDKKRQLLTTDATEGPNGETVYHNGIVLEGVTAEGKPNEYITSNPEYFWLTYNWGGPQYNPNGRYELFMKENTYVKMRELAIAYQLPKDIVQKIGLQSLNVSVFGRNLFFLYRTIKNMDPEQLTGGSRWNQNVTYAGTNPASRTYGVSLRTRF